MIIMHLTNSTAVYVGEIYEAHNLSYSLLLLLTFGIFKAIYYRPGQASVCVKVMGFYGLTALM